VEIKLPVDYGVHSAYDDIREMLKPVENTEFTITFIKVKLESEPIMKEPNTHVIEFSKAAMSAMFNSEATINAINAETLGGDKQYEIMAIMAVNLAEATVAELESRDML